LTAEDTSTISAVTGAASLAGAVGAVGVSVSIGIAGAYNEISNDIAAYITNANDGVKTTSGNITIEAFEEATINAITAAASLAVSGGFAAVSISGAGAGATNVILTDTNAYIYTSTVRSADNVNITADSDTTINAAVLTASGAVSIGGVAVGASIGASAARNFIGYNLWGTEDATQVQAYITDSTLKAADDVILTADSDEEINAVVFAGSVAVSAGAVSASFSGAGAVVTNRMAADVKTYIDNSTITGPQATGARAGDVILTAHETSGIFAVAGAASLAGSVGYIGASVSIGVAVASNSIANDVEAYVNNSTVTAASLDVEALEDAYISAVSAAASGAVSASVFSYALSGGGAEASSTIANATKAYASGGAINVEGNLTIRAEDNSMSSADVIGISIAAGLISVSEGGSVAYTSITSTVDAYLDVPTVYAGDITVAATAVPAADVYAEGVNAGTLSVGASVAVATVSPDVTAWAGGNGHTITADSLLVSAAQSGPGIGYTAQSNATGSSGGLIGINATESTAETTGTVTSYIGNKTNLIVADAVTVQATGDSKQKADGDSNAYGLVAAGANVVDVSSDIDTSAYLQNGVNITAGDAMGGVTDGGLYYVVVDDTRYFDPDEDISADRIDLGDNHGLQTGDTVIYHKGTGNAVGGLTRDESYIVELSNTDPKLVRLHDYDTNALISLDGSAASGTGHSFQIVEPRQIKLASSFENATDDTPVTLDLSDPSIFGFGHTLTPYRSDGGVVFDPTTVDAETDRITIGTDNGFYTGQAVVYTKGIGPDLTISASGTDYNFARSEAGSGGLVAGAAAEANVDADSTTRAYIADGTSTNHSTLEVTRLNINAAHTAKFDSQTDTFQASAVGFSGSWATNDVNATAEAQIGNNAKITTYDLIVEATNTSRKDLVGELYADGLLDSDYNVKTGSGGVFEGNAAESETDIANRTYTTIGDYATIDVVGSLYNPGNFILRAYNDVEGTDDVKLDSGGVIVGSAATSAIRADINDGIVSIGNNAHITSVGDVNLEALARGVLKVEPQVHTYGLASAAAVDGMARIHNDNDVSVGENTFIESYGEINLLAGRDHDGIMGYFHVTSHGDELNASVIPIEFLTSHGEIVQDHAITVESGAILRSAQDTNLLTEREGNAEIWAYGSGKNWMTAVAGGIDSMLGSDGISEEMKGGTSTLELYGDVTIEGSIEVGILKEQALVIDMDGSVVEQPESVKDITFTASEESLAANLVAEREHWYALKAAYAGDAVAVAAYQAEIDRVEALMEELGLYDEEYDVYLDCYIVPYITVDDIWAQAGTINVWADNMYGSGDLIAPNDVTVTITNNSPSYLRINNITIPDNQGGDIKFNSQSVLSNDDIADINMNELAPVPTFSLTTAATGAAPTITITNTFDADDPHDSPFDRIDRSPDIELVGDIEAILATLTVTGEGNVISTGNINVGTLVIDAGGDFVQTYTECLFNVGGNPGTNWSNVTDITQADKIDRSGVNAVDHSLDTGPLTSLQQLEQAVYDALYGERDSNIIAANNVYISAQYLNINGILQSGIADRWVTVTADQASAVQGAELVYSQYRAGDVSAANATLTTYGLETTDWKYFLLPAEGNVDVFWNAELDRLELESVKIQGGFMQLFGEIVSTGGGQIKVMDGYGRIVIDNRTDYDLVTNLLDTGTGVEGLLKITDTLFVDGQGDPLVTEYRYINGHVYKKTYYLGDTVSGNGTSVSTTRQTSHSPKDGMRYYWANGQDYSEKVVTTYGSSEWLGIDALAADPDNIIEGPTRTKVGDITRLTDAERIADTGSVVADYIYDYQQITTDTSTTQRKTWEETTWYGKTTYYVKETVITPYKDIHTSSVRADRDINIEFIGYEEGDSRIAVDVDSGGNVLINKSIQNEAGTTSLESENGSIRLLNDTASIGSRSIDLTAETGIGADKTLRTNLNDTGNGSFSAVTTSGDIDVVELSGDLTIDQVTTGDGDVTLTTPQSILAADGASLVKGNKISLTATYGSIGTLGTNGTAVAPDTDALAVRIDSGGELRSSLTAAASGNVYLVETTGDLYVDRVETSGDIRVQVNSGNLVDGNTNEVVDPRTEAQLESLWDRMLATEDTAQISINATISAYEAGKTNEYQAYWRYRNRFDGTYSADQKVTLSAAEQTWYTNYYKGQGMTDSEAADAISTLEDKRTTEYHSLHKIYGVLGDTYDSDWTYDVTDEDLHQFGSGDIDGNAIDMDHVFTTGTALVYHCGSGGIEGLTDGETYYVVVGDDSSIQLAATQADANASVVITLGTVTGSGHTLSDGDALSQRAAWSEDQLKNSMSASILRPKTVSGTTITEEDPNFTGNDITLVVSGRIGISTGQIDIALPLTDAMSTEDKLALAAAERDDVTFYDQEGNIMEADDMDKTAALVRVINLDDVDLDISGLVNVVAGTSATSTVNLGSEGSLQIDQVSAGGEVRIKVQEGIIDARPGVADHVNIISGDLILEGENQSIGSAANPLLTDIGTNSTLIARANYVIYIEEVSGDVRVEEIFANNHIDLRVQGSILDAFDDDGTLEGDTWWNFYTESIYLQAGGSIGASDNYMETDMQNQDAYGQWNGGTFNILAGGDIYLHEIVGNMFVNEVKSTGGDVGLKAAFSILDTDEGTEGNPAVDVYGNDIILTAEGGWIGASGDDIDINSAYSGAGTLSSSSEYNTYIIEPNGDLSLYTVATNAGTAFIAALNGSIFNGNATGYNVTSGKTYLFAGGNIGQPVGTEGGPITTELGGIEAQSTSGGTWVVNDGNLTEGGVVDSGNPGMWSGGDNDVTALSPITITENVLAGGAITRTATEHAEAGDDITIKAGIHVESTDGGDITFYVGDNFTLEAGALISTTGDVYIYADWGDADPGFGSTITIYGTIDAANLYIYGAGDEDQIFNYGTINLSNVVNIYGDDSDDQINLTSNIAAKEIHIYGYEGDDTVTITGAMIATDAFTIDTGDGDDTVTVTETGSITVSNGYVTVDTRSIAEKEGETEAGSEADTIQIDGAITASGNVNFITGVGEDVVIITGSVSASNITINTGADHDIVTIDIDYNEGRMLTGPVQVYGGDGTDWITVNKLHTRTDIMDIDSGNDRDLYFINTRGTDTDQLTRIYDTGESGVDEITINGTAEDDVFLLRAMALEDPEVPNTGFVAKLNNDSTEVERFNYRGIEGITLNTLYGNDSVASDDTLVVFTINGGVGDDSFQIGQVFKSERNTDDSSANIAEDDVFATIEITRGWLSNGITAPMTINGGEGNDEFTVFHNKAVLTLFGGDGDDSFTVRSFALAGSQDDQRARTDMKGDAGIDTIRYAVNAPVGIDGGDGFDMVSIIGTEFSDDFVITDQGVFGGGLYVTYVNIEKLRVDGAEGDDRYFVLSTNADMITEIDGGLGSDSFFIGGSPSDAPIPVISNDLKGHSGVILNNVESEDSLYDGITVDGISANVADNDEDFIVVTESGGVSAVTEDIPALTVGLDAEGWDYDTYTVALTRAPEDDETVTISVLAQQPAPEDDAKGYKTIEFWVPNTDTEDPYDGTWEAAAQLTFNTSNWQTAQTVKFRAVHDDASESKQFALINHKVESSDTSSRYHQLAMRSVKVQVNDDDQAGAIITPTGRSTLVIEGGMTDQYAVVLTREPSVDVTVALDPYFDQLLLSGDNLVDNQLVFTPGNYNVAQIVTVTALDDVAKEGFHTDYISHTLTSADVDEPLPASYQIDGDTLVGGVNDIPETKPLDTVLLQHKPIAETFVVTVTVGEDTETLAANRFGVFGNTLVFFGEDGETPEAIWGKVEVSYNYEQPGYEGALADRIVVDIADNEVASVVVIESDGSTDVIEGGVTDTYQMVLTKAPTEDVTINIDAIKTRTTGSNNSGNFAFFEEQLLVKNATDTEGLSLTTLTFTTENWNTPQTVTVSAIDDNFVDGSDTQVFVPGQATLNKIHGPLFIEGAAGGGSLSLPDPLMLAGELNVRPTDGNVVEFESGAGPGAIESMTVETADLLAIADIYDVSDLIGRTLEMTKGPGTGVVLNESNPDQKFDRFWMITNAEDHGDGTTSLALQNPSQVDPSNDGVTAPTSASEYAITSLSINFFADEAEQVDYLFVYDQDSVADDTGALTSQIFGEGDDAVLKGRITGLGMGPDATIGGTTQPGGITYGDLEAVQVNLGSGNDTLTVDYTTISTDHTTERDSEFYTLTMVNTGEGDDKVTVNLTADEDGAFALNTQRGGDTVIGTGSTAPLIVFGEEGNDSITGGDGADILFGDYGRVDYADADGYIVTRLGHTWEQNPVNPPVTAFTEENSVITDDTASFPTTYGELVGLSVQLICEDGSVQYRTIAANTGTTISVDTPWTVDDSKKYFYRVSMLPEDQTDGTVRGPSVVWSIYESTGGTDEIKGNGGNDMIIGGAAADTIYGGNNNDLIAGDNARFDFRPTSGHDGMTVLTLAQTTSPSIGDVDTTYGDAGNDTIFGGQAGDKIYAGEGNNIVLGDDGKIDYDKDGNPSDVDLIESFSITADGGVDEITSGSGSDLIVGGRYGDTIEAGDGNNLVIGDSGKITAANDDSVQQLAGIPMTFGEIETITFGDGGVDTITTLGGHDILLGGHEGDIINAGEGNNIVLGDDGQIDYTRADRGSMVSGADANAADIDVIESLSTDYAGGADTITTGAGNDIIIGGRYGDTLDAGDGDNIVIGDSGRITADSDMTLRWPGQLMSIGKIETTTPDDGSADTITTLTGDDIILGGTDADTIHAGDGVDTVFGDQGEVRSASGDGNHVITYGSEPQPWFEGYYFEATWIHDDAAGTGDLIYGEGGRDYILGQQGYDVIFGGAGDDDIYGGHNVAEGHDVGDIIDGGTGNDVIAGDNASIQGTDDYLNPRFRALQGTVVIYDSNGVAQETKYSQRDPNQVHARTVELYDSSHSPDTATLGNDLIAGGADDDVIFGQLGNDILHGDGRITDPVLTATTIVYEEYDLVALSGSTTGSDIGGDDYVEGNGGNDTIYGGLGQDDLIGGNSTLFGLTTHDQRPDGSDLIFGGNGDMTDRNNLGDGLHTADADTILGDNGNIYRLVSVSQPGVTAYLTFNYDNYNESRHIIPRAAELIDYTVGGPDYNPTGAANDIGVADIIHGESGDDFIYGMVGDDVLYGEGQDDDIIGGYGNDWISGGTGDDGVLGDDGRIYTSRNSTLGEPLYGIAGLVDRDSSTRSNDGDVLDEFIYTPGKIQQSTINVTGELKKSVNITPFNLDPIGVGGGIQNPLDDPLYADDIIYGGWGNDFLHGGAGDDAISGAEALPEFYDNPVNNGDVLGYGLNKAGEFALYDEYNPLEKIDEFLLNFNATEGPTATGTNTDGDDAIFGDLGNDWIVGGAGRDHLYGGWGDDLLNADDNLETAEGLNNAPDTDITYEDIAYGGAGRDVLIANTGGDRLVDWAGEFNSYIVPFAPYGMATISRTIQPQLPEYLYALSMSDGVDMTRANDTGNDPDRNGEPDGELGLVKQRDSAWQDQTGAPADPQAGNIAGGRRDVLRSASFNDGLAQGFSPDSGTWSVVGGRYQVAATTLGGDAVSVFYVDTYIPSYFEMSATIRAVKPVAGYNANAYLIFDYQCSNDFKFAGINVSTSKLEIGYRDASGWHVVVQTPYTGALKADTDYNVFLALNGSTATLIVNSRITLNYTFALRVDEYGYEHFLNEGMVGLGANNANGQIDNVLVRRIAPETTLEKTVEFTSGDASDQAVFNDLFQVPVIGSWQMTTDSRYVGTTETGGLAIDLVNLQVAPASVLELNALFNTATQGGFVFDYYGPEDFKFVTLSVKAGEVVIGHSTTRTGLVIDASRTAILSASSDYKMGVTLAGTTVSVTINEQATISYAYNALVTDGEFGLLARDSAVSFDTFTVRTDDSAYSAPAALPELSVSDASVTEGNDGTKAVSVMITLSATSDKDISVNYTTVDGTAVAGTDYQSATGMLSFAPGESSKQLTLFVLGDQQVEADETFSIELSNSVNATITDGFGQVTITNDDLVVGPALPNLSISDAGILEGNKTNKTKVNVTVSLSKASATPVTVRLATVDGTAVSGSDYVAVTDTIINFAAGETSKDYTLTINGDKVGEPYETFTAILSNAVGATIADGSGTVTILNDDGAAMTAVVEAAGDMQEVLVGDESLEAIVDEAIERWTGTITMDERTVATLNKVDFQIVDFAGLTLGLMDQKTVYLDTDAAGYGWFIDPTPFDDSEFAGSNKPAGMDILTVVMHELGHVLGYEDVATTDGVLMSEELSTGVRYVPADMPAASIPSSSASTLLNFPPPSNGIPTGWIFENASIVEGADTDSWWARLRRHILGDNNKAHDVLPILLNLREVASAGGMENGNSIGATVSLLASNKEGEHGHSGAALGAGQNPWVTDFLLDGTGKANPNKGIKVSI